MNLGISPWLGMWAGAAVAIAAALLVGISCLQLRGAYFALASIASCMVLKTLVENADTLLGGPRGMEVTLLRDAPLYFQHTGKAFYYIVALVFTVAALLVNRHVLRSRFGYCLTAVRNDQEAAMALGVPVRRYKLSAAALSAAMTALGGTFYAQFVLYISPDKVFGANLSVVIAVVCIIGGRGTLWGPVLGAVLLLPGEELARSLTGGMVGADMMLYGLLLMIIIRWEPRGLMALLTRRAGAPIRHGGGAAKPSDKPRGNAMSLLEFLDVSRNFGGVQASDRVSFTVGADEIVGLIGPNGAGKTTLFSMASGFVPPSSGDIRFNGDRINGKDPARICAAGLARTFQIVKPFGDMTVLENAMIGAFLRHRVRQRPPRPRRPCCPASGWQGASTRWRAP